VPRNPLFAEALPIVYQGRLDDDRLARQYAAGRGRVPPRVHRSIEDFVAELLGD
jgi:predicted metal-dependent peptidase